MTERFVLTAIGADRPGLVNALSGAIAASGGNWLDARWTTLGGHFAGILEVEVAAGGRDAMTAALRALPGLTVTVRDANDTAPEADAAGPTLTLELLAQDQPGIVRDISRVLAEHRVSIVELDTERSSGSFSGEAMFKATARLRLPPDLAPQTLRAALEMLANELMVDLSVQDV